MARNNTNKRIAKNTLFLYLRMVIVMFITLFTTRELLSALGVDDYGIYNVVCGFVSMFAFLQTTMANGIQRFYNYEIGRNGEKDIAKIFSHAFLIQLGMALLISFVVETIGLWYFYNKIVIPDGRLFAASWIFQFAMFQLFMIMMTVPYSAAVMAYEHMNFYAFVGIIDAILKLVIVYMIEYSIIDDLIFYGALMTLISLINYVLNLLFCLKMIPSVRFVRQWDKKLFSNMLSFSGWNVFGSLSHMMQNQGVNLILNAFWGTVINAANGVAHQINSAVNSLTSGFVTAVRPQMIKSYASGDVNYLKKMYYSVSKLTFFLVMILAIPLISEIDVILDFWLGEGKYPEITPLFAQLSMFMAICNSYATPSSIIVHATGKMKMFQIVVSFVTLMVVPFAYIAAKMGCTASFILVISIIITVLAHISRLLVIRKLVNFAIIDYAKKVFLPTWIVFILAICFTFYVHVKLPYNVVFSLLNVFVSMAFSVFLILIIGLNSSEKKLLMSFVNKKIK